MIDIPKVGGYGSYNAFDNGAKRNDVTEESSFSKVFGENETGEVNNSVSGSSSKILEEVLSGSSRADFEIYTLFGKTRSLGNFTGKNINIEV